MRKKRKHLRPEPISVRRVLGEANAKGYSPGRYRCVLNLSEVLGSLPMTVDQEDIQIEATFEKGGLNILVYCDEWITPENPAGGIYAFEEKDED